MIGTFFWDKRKVLTSRETIICSRGVGRDGRKETILRGQNFVYSDDVKGVKAENLVAGKSQFRTKREQRCFSSSYYTN